MVLDKLVVHAANHTADPAPGMHPDYAVVRDASTQKDPRDPHVIPRSGLGFRGGGGKAKYGRRLPGSGSKRSRNAPWRGEPPEAGEARYSGSAFRGLGLKGGGGRGVHLFEQGFHLVGEAVLVAPDASAPRRAPYSGLRSLKSWTFGSSPGRTKGVRLLCILSFRWLIGSLVVVRCCRETLTK